MKTKKTILQLIFIALIATTLTLTNTANATHNGRNSIIGTWLLEVDSNIPDAAPITALVSFQRGGTLIVSQNGIHENSETFDPICGCNATNGHGIWKRKGFKKYEFKFTFLLFAGPLTASFPLNVTDPVIGVGQHIGYGLVKNARIIIDGDKLSGTNIGAGLNLEGENINPNFRPISQSFKGKRLKFRGADIPLLN